jgi:hypothetical protein
MVRDGERIAIALVAEGELSLEVGTPEIIGMVPAESAVPRALLRRRPMRLTRPLRSSTAWMVGREGTLISACYSTRTENDRSRRTCVCA